jgi:hypothetical protein
VGNIDALGDAIKAVLRGDVPSAPLESWRAFELDAVVEQYLGVLLGGDDIPATVENSRSKSFASTSR